MANNIVQVKRTSVSGRTPNTTGSYATNSQYISAGELALNMSDGILYSSNGSAVITIGANNRNVNVSGNLTINAIIANGSIGSSGQVLTTNGSSTYWASISSNATVNTAAQYNWTNTHTFNANVTLNGIIANGSVGTADQTLFSNGSTTFWANNNATIGYTIDGGGSVITTGVAGSGIRVPFACNISSVSVVSSQTGNIVIDIWEDSFINYPPTVADSITANAKLTINNSRTYEDTTLTGWNRAIAAGDVLLFNVDSCSNITNCSIFLRVVKRN